MSKLRCRHNSCGNEYIDSENTDASCVYHPGTAIFHDALKGWSCCQKRVRDFSDFLSIPGCTTGKHDHREPVVVSNPSEQKQQETSVSAPAPSQPKIESKIITRDSNEPRQPLKVKVAASLQKRIQTLKQQNPTPSSTSETTSSPEVVFCQNHGCSARYTSPESNNETCVFHPGVPVFHEGVKFWSCCRSKVFDFDELLAQVGCTQGKHVWKKEKTVTETKCRHDWYQTARDVIVSFFAKDIDYETAVIEANNASLYIHIEFEGNKEFETLLELSQVIDVEQSSVELFGTKMEFKLRKGDASAWTKLSALE